MTAIVIQVAMEEEAQPFLDAAREVSESIEVGRATHRGVVLGGATIVLVTSGIGMVNAADAATGAILRYGPEGVILISAGSAGGLGADVAVGDIVVGSDVVNVAADATAFGYALGQVPGMPATYPTDPQLATALAGAGGARRGAMGSGEAFVTADLAHRLRADFPEALTVDMETAAIAQVAFNHSARFAVCRAVSDLCAPDAGEFETHIDDAASRSAAAVIDALARLAA
ncbi:5'-methylthioadenosine/S-adenosylhomocysteine nucleosidase [Microbacterium karelineae]|uniref:5'-methylthioadenosine/S-adenosylhomocysteine nucleosidase n=1 Tax=Microbacterium karelineae TaxID=2654283 RepID=UPI0012E9DD92|nr:5'-methylthioadenosine/S-adenosylhomocysteine nucleosidase [Microbacterium karelineae]